MNQEIIETEYQRRLSLYPECPWGWSFMYVPQEQLHTARIALVGLNPGGSHTPEENQWHYTKGKNAYIDEKWNALEAGKHPLQLEVARLFEAISASGEDVFAANLIPFRSPSWEQLPDRAGAIRFGLDLWTWTLSQSPARLFISIGKVPGRHLAGLLRAHLVGRTEAGWKPQTIDTYRAEDGRTVIALPHLSRFKIFSKERTLASDLLKRLPQVSGR
ncbi:hypothetical protein ACLBXM_04515 [Xanthobacteraceae bacterium A53D]